MENLQELAQSILDGRGYTKAALLEQLANLNCTTEQLVDAMPTSYRATIKEWLQ